MLKVIICWVHTETVLFISAEIFRNQPVFRCQNKKLLWEMFWKSVSSSHDTVMHFECVASFWKGVGNAFSLKKLHLKRLRNAQEIWRCLNLQCVYKTISIYLWNILMVHLNSSIDWTQSIRYYFLTNLTITAKFLHNSIQIVPV